MNILVLILSAIVFLVVALLLYSEYRGNVFSKMLERRNIIEITQTKRQDYWAVQSWTNCIKKMNISCDVVFFGDSLTYGSNFQNRFPDKTIVNLGYAGNTIIDMLNRILMIEYCNPKKIFIMAGTNDLVHISIDDYKNRYIRLINLIKKRLPHTKIYIESVIPSNDNYSGYAPNIKVQSANKAIKEYSESIGITFIDLYSKYYIDGNLPKSFTNDGVHLLPSAYSLWEDEIQKYIYE